MKKYIPFILLVALFTVSFDAHSQCRSFAKKVCKSQLAPYFHDGNYNAAILAEGEDTTVYKTFVPDQQYRIAVCGAETLPKIRWQVFDANRNVLFDNAQHNYTSTWDFCLQSRQQLIIVAKALRSNTGNDNSRRVRGCVSILFGLLNTDR
ncbi:MAG: hypothetical protein JXA20_15390 [Spirochaetes bacterium]|nr:hypothetical protein [Spirochaetota bacterium]